MRCLAMTVSCDAVTVTCDTVTEFTRDTVIVTFCIVSLLTGSPLYEECIVGYLD